MSYGRKYRLTFGKPYPFTENSFAAVGGGELTVPLARATPEERRKNIDQYLSNETNVAIVEELNIEFDITKKFDASPNEAEIIIYNLSDSTAGYLEENTGQKVFIKLEAGYEDEEEGIKTIFLGNVGPISETFDTEDRITKLYCTDGGEEMRNAMISRYYPKGTSYDAMVDDIIQVVGLPRGDIIPFGAPYTTKQGVYFVGKATDALKQIAENAGSFFTIQDLALTIVPEDKPVQRRCAYISPETGLIGSPSLIDESQTQGKKPDASKGIKFTCLLNGAIIPNEVVVLESRRYKGQYKVTKVRHFGEYEGDSWYTEVEAQEFSETANAD